MSGRKLFAYLKPFIDFLVLILRIFPRSFQAFIWNLMNSYPGIIGMGVRYCLFKAMAKRCGNNVLIDVNVEIRGWDTLEVGENVSFNRESYVDAKGGLCIGNNVSIAHQSSIMTENHTWFDESLPIKYNSMKPASVKIENDVWIGCAVRVMPGVTIHTRSVVAAGAIVTKDVESRTVVGGNPAKIIKTI